MGDMTECWIYKGSKHTEMYLYVAAEDDFEAVPDELLSALGRLQLVMSLELVPERKLARADTRKVIEALSTRGYFLQLPPAGPVVSC